MLLLAVAVVFIGLGLHAVVTDDDPDTTATQTTAAQTPQETGSPSAASETSDAPPSTTSEDVSDVGTMCVLNAGTVTGLAGDVSDSLKEAGFDVSGAENLSTGSISENTVFYDEGQEAAAKKVADAVPGGASTDPRPAVFTRCEGELVVIVVTQ